VAPIAVPAEIAPEESIDLGVEGGVPGGVEGGVPGGVVGGVVGGLPQEPPPPPKAVRVGGKISAPKILKKVNPEYPELARLSGTSAMIILEATADETGQVREVKILRGQPLFNDAAVSAVRQWRYRPLLLNGIPTPFVITVTLVFNIQRPQVGQ
jgi:protein TonB